MHQDDHPANAGLQGIHSASVPRAGIKAAHTILEGQLDQTSILHSSSSPFCELRFHYGGVIRAAIVGPRRPRRPDRSYRPSIAIERC